MPDHPDKLGDYDTLGDLLGYTSPDEIDKELLIEIFSDYLREYGRHPVLYGRSIEPRGTGDNTIREYAAWTVRELFIALDWATRTGEGIDANRLHAVEAHK